MNRKPIMQIQPLRLLSYRYRLKDSDDYRHSFAVGFTGDDVVDDLYVKYPEMDGETMTMEVVFSAPLEWIWSQVEKKDIDLRTAKMKKKNFVFNLRYTKDYLLKDEKDKKALDKIISRIE